MGLDLSQTVTPPRAPGGANKDDNEDDNLHDNKDENEDDNDWEEYDNKAEDEVACENEDHHHQHQILTWIDQKFC